MNIPTFGKSTLADRNRIGQNRSKTISHCLSHQFGETVDETYWPKILHLCGISLVRQEGDECCIEEPELKMEPLLNC